MDNTPDITGLPPDIMLMNEVEGLKEEIHSLKEEIHSLEDEKGGWLEEHHTKFHASLTTELDARAVGGTGYAKCAEILSKLDALLAKANNATIRVASSCTIIVIGRR